jgi:hypothetical protein
MPIVARADRGGARRDCLAAIRAAAGDQVGRGSLRGRVPSAGPRGTVAGGRSIGHDAVHGPGRRDDPVSCGPLGSGGGRRAGERCRPRCSRGADGEARVCTTLVGSEASGAGAPNQGRRLAPAETQGTLGGSRVVSHSCGSGTDVGCRSPALRTRRSIGSRPLIEISRRGRPRSSGFSSPRRAASPGLRWVGDVKPITASSRDPCWDGRRDDGTVHSSHAKSAT